MVTVYINMGDAPRPVTLTFATANKQRRPISVTPYITSDGAGDELKQYPPLRADATIGIPGKSVVTLVSELE